MTTVWKDSKGEDVGVFDKQSEEHTELRPTMGAAIFAMLEHQLMPGCAS